MCRREDLNLQGQSPHGPKPCASTIPPLRQVDTIVQ